MKNQQTNPGNDSVLDQLFKEWSEGSVVAGNKLIELFYPEIHKIAHLQLRSKSPGLLQTTAVVNEAYLSIQNNQNFGSMNKKYFLGIAAKVIRNVIVTHFRQENSKKRGGAKISLTIDRLEEVIKVASCDGSEWLNLHYLLSDMKNVDVEAAQVVEYKVFGGMTIPEIANLMTTSESTVSRNWKFARLWLLSQMKKND